MLGKPGKLGSRLFVVSGVETRSVYVIDQDSRCLSVTLKSTRPVGYLVTLSRVVRIRELLRERIGVVDDRAAGGGAPNVAEQPGDRRIDGRIRSAQPKDVDLPGLAARSVAEPPLLRARVQERPVLGAAARRAGFLVVEEEERLVAAVP